MRFGPSATLGLSEYIDLYRATRQRAPAWNLGQRTTGDASQSEVKGHNHSHSSHVVSPPSRGAVAVGIWGAGISFRKNPANPSQWQLMVNPKSTIGTSPSTADQIAVSGGLGEWGETDSGDTMVVLIGTLGGTTPGVSLNIGAGAFSISAKAFTSNGWIVGDTSSTPMQTKWQLAIATLDWSSGAPVAVPIVTTNLIIWNVAVGGYAAVFPY